MTSNRQRLLRYGEYAAVSASVAGAIAAVATRQILYGVAPLSVAAVLNLISRRQWEHRIEHHLAHTTTQVGQQFDRLNQKNRLIEQRLRELAPEPATDTASAEALQSLRADVSQLAHDLQAWRQRKDSPERAEGSLEVETLSADLRQLRVTVAALESLGLEDRLQTVEQRLPTEPIDIGPAIAELRTDFDQLSRDLAQLKTEVARLTTLLREVPTTGSALSSFEAEPPPGVEVPPQPEFQQWAPPQLPSTEDFTLEINLGIDFGTGFTKVCFRDLASDRSEVVTFADSDEAELEQALLSTQVAILEDGQLLTGLTVAEWAQNPHPVRQMMQFIKMRLAHLDIDEDEDSAWRLERIPELDDPETVENVCAYYLSRVIARAQHWVQQNRADLFKNQTVRWSLNVGVPVEYCDSPALIRFQKVLSLAWLLVNSASFKEMLTLSALNSLSTYLREWIHQELEDQLGSLDCSTTPEIAAAAWSFVSSRQAQDGIYTFFDFGDGTLDGTTFRFWREEGELNVDFYVGRVRPLGVTAFVQQTATELNTSPDTVQQAIREWQETAKQILHAQIEISQTRREVQKLVGFVVKRGDNKHKANRGMFAQYDLGDKLDVFLGGGGGQNPFFQATVESTYDNFDHNRAGIPPYKICRVPVPPDLHMNGLNPEEFHRFAVAYGLCIPSWEGPGFRLPSQVEANAETHMECSNRETRYEDTKDLT
jgi:hypothetical protein